MMKVGVSSYSFQRYLSEGKSDIFGVIRMAAEIGFDGIEFSGLNGKASDDPKVLAAQIKDACAAAGLPVVSYTIGADFLNPPKGGDWKDEVERLKTEVDIAAILGVPAMRHDATRGFDEKRIHLADFLEALPVLEQGCREVTKYAADKGVKTMVENHGFCVQDSERCELLMNKVNHPNFGALVDLGNFLCADDDPVRAVTRMSKYAFHVHAKDFHVKQASADPGNGWFRSRGGAWLRGAIIGHGNVDVPGCVKAIVASGYDGFCSIEFEGMEDNKGALEIGLANLKRYIAAASL
jgi:sugar phosphate isomerase/epimerase